MKLEWKDNRADVSKYLGGHMEYECHHRPQDSRYIVLIRNMAASTDPNTLTYATIAEAKQAAQEHFNARLKEPMTLGQAIDGPLQRGCEMIAPDRGVILGVVDGELKGRRVGEFLWREMRLSAKSLSQPIHFYVPETDQ